MKFLKNNINTFCFLAIAVVFAFCGEANADVMSSATTKAAATFESIKKIMFVIGGFGLVGIAFGAIFGKVKWTWFAGLAVGLAILAAAGSIVNYATGDTAQGISDTFQ